MEDKGIKKEESKRIINEFKKTIDETKEDVNKPACDEEVQEAVEKINPDGNSMESRG